MRPSEFSRHILTATAIVILSVIAGLLVWGAVDVFLLIFAAVLGAVLLRTPVNWLIKKTKLGPGLSLTLVILILLGLLISGGVLLGPGVAEEAEKLVEILPKSPSELQELVEEQKWGRQTLGQIPGIYEDIFRAVEGLLSNADVLLAPIQLTAYFLFFLFVAFYFSVEPAVYQRSLVQVLPQDKREHGEELLRRLTSTIRWFLVARVASMTIVGVLTIITLIVLDIPLAFFLGLVAGTLTFVPYLGPISATIPIALVVLIQAPEQLLMVVFVYTVIQLFEGYVLTPVFQKLTVYVPPAMTLITEVLMGVFFGALGIIMAAPFVAVFLMFYQTVYREDILGEEGVAQRRGG
jgi:predicted PurR-regulated permease PerM